MNLQPNTPARSHSLGQKAVHFVVGLAALAILGSVGLVALTWGAKKAGMLPAKSAPTQSNSASTGDRWARIEAKLQANEAKWQDAALSELRSTVPIYAGGVQPNFEHCTVLARSEDGKHLVAEAVWFDKSLPSDIAPRVSSIALIHDRGENKPEVVQLGSCPLRPDLTPSRVQDLTRRVQGAKWSLGNF